VRPSGPASTKSCREWRSSRNRFRLRQVPHSQSLKQSAPTAETSNRPLPMHSSQKPLRALALSLFSDPFYQAITVEYCSVEAKLITLETYFEYSLLEAERTGHVVILPNESRGAAAWLLPRSPEVQAMEAGAKKRFMAELLGPKGSQNYHAIVDYMSPLAESHVPAKAWYLSIVGIHPEAQGQGLGKKLLQPTLEEASRLGRVCYLETFTPSNIGFYKHLGFVQVAAYAEPTTGSTYAIMRRDA
jgi:GNAT superfamily N-acetyltransferase